MHSQLIRFPDIAFFTSPIPLHIAAMVILYGHISQVDCLPPPVALEDVGLALDMIPRFRWRWERKDANGGHPLIAKLVETIMRVNLHTIVPSSSSSVLYCELDWEEVTSPTLGAQLGGTPPLASPHTAYASAGGAGDVAYGPHPRAHAHNGASARAAAASGSGGANNGASGGGTERLADMPQGLLYPFYPEAEAHLTTPFPGAGAPAEPGGATVHTYDPLLRQAAALQGAYGTGAEQAHGDVARVAPHAPMWTHVRPPASQPAKPH